VKIGLKKLKNKKWICKADEGSVADEEEEDEESADEEDNDEEHSTDEEDADGNNAENFNTAGPEPVTPTAPDQFARFEQMMMTQFNQLHEQNHSHHQYCEKSLPTH